jgi:tetratricopeptide (TPR) repeat protein
VAQEPSIGIAQEKTKLRLRIANALTLLHAFYRGLTWERAKAVVNGALSNISKLLWIVLVVVIVTFVVQDISSDLITIEPISVPKAFSESGYTAEVASHRLNDALNAYAKNAGSSMQGPSIVARDELPKFVVPKVDLSLETIGASVRSLLHYGNRRAISGELTVRGKLAWLRLRVDGREAYSSPKGFDLENPDELFAEAVPAIMDKIRPYLIAASIYNSDQIKGIEKADEIIARLPDSDVNVQWSYVLKGLFLTDHQRDHVQAEGVLRKAIRLNDANSAAHHNLGNTLRQQGKGNEAIAEYRRAIDLDPNYAKSHAALGVTLMDQGKADEAISEFHRAIQLSPSEAVFHFVLGIIYTSRGSPNEAVGEYRLAIKMAPQDAAAYNNLGSILRQQGKLDEAVLNLRNAVKFDPNDSDAYDKIAAILREQGKLDDAITEYRNAISANPNDENTKKSLESALREQDRKSQ